MEIENDRGVSRLLDGASPEVLSDAYTFTEGPVWVAGDGEDGSLIFSDIPTSTAHRWRPGDPVDRPSPVFRTNTRNGNGMTMDAQGRILCCEQNSRQLVRFSLDDPDTIEVIASEWNGKRLNSPNDVVVHESGRIYFTDPIYGLGPGGEGKEQPHSGVYRVDPDGGIALVDDRFHQPNGLVFTPDQRQLIVSDTQQQVVRRFDVHDDGSLTGGAVFVDMRKTGMPGSPDGMTIDTDGRLWATGPGGIWVVEQNGEVLGVLPIPHQPANLTFGGADLRTLFVTAETGIYAIQTSVTGVVPGPAAVAAR
ncbi:MAG TPA: SMP-30/gluconolactonase/LRE family protein [Thermomicrobiales bacterium]|nr:SMP-30/gluconolactonase/LRE family protein [Thermomicrobiales bacterium]